MNPSRNDRRIQIPPPLGGIAEINGLDRQPPGTTTKAENVRARDPVSGRYVCAQRAGSVPYSETALAGQPVRALLQVGHDRAGVSYTALTAPSSASEVQEDTPPAKDGSTGVVTDQLGNTYWIDGQSGIVKRNPEGNQVFKLTLPVPEGATVGDLVVDGLLRIFACTAKSTSPTRSRIWCYDQTENDKTERLWEIQPDWSCVRLRLFQGELLVAQENQSLREARVVSYIGLENETPTESRTWDTTTEFNDMCVSPTDGGVYTAHGPDETRGENPTDPAATPGAIVWSPEELDDFDNRVWAWWKSDDIDGDGSMNTNRADFSETDLWRSTFKGELRYLIPTSITTQGTGAVVADDGPLLVKNAIGGRDAVYFNGTSNSMMSGSTGAASGRTSNFVANTIVPNYVGAQFAMFMMVRAIPQASTPRTLFLQWAGPSTDEHALRSQSIILGYAANWTNGNRGWENWAYKVGEESNHYPRFGVHLNSRIQRVSTARANAGGVITAPNHGFQNGDLVAIYSAAGSVTGYGSDYMGFVGGATADTFSIYSNPDLVTLVPVTADQASDTPLLFRGRARASFDGSNATLVSTGNDTVALGSIFSADTDDPFTETEPVVFYPANGATMPTGLTAGNIYWTVQFSGVHYLLNQAPTEDGTINAFANITAVGAGTIYCYRVKHPRYPVAGPPLQPGSIGAGYGNSDKQKSIVGGMDNDGTLILSWVQCGGWDDDPDNPTRSQFRINGQPVDRWLGADQYQGGVDKKQYLGLQSNDNDTARTNNPYTFLSRFKGYVCEILVLCDRARPNTDSSSLQPYAYQRLIETPKYPHVGFTTGGDTELERIEGYLAWKWGRAHKLPAHPHWSFQIRDVAAGDWVEVDGIYYSFVATPTATIHTGLVGDKHEVRAGTGGNADRDSADNLMAAINGAEPGATHSPGSEHANWIARNTFPHLTLEEASANIDDLDQCAIFLEARNGSVAVPPSGDIETDVSGMVVFERTNFAGLEWICRPDGDFPHPFSSRFSSGRTTGGPPRTDAWDTRWNDALTSTAGLLVKWDSNNGRLRWALTGETIGGVGFACEPNSAGEIYSVGPRDGTSHDILKVVDAGASYDIAGASAAVTEPWREALAAAFDDDARPHLAVDKYDNVYVPVKSSGTTISMVMLSRKPTAMDDGDVLCTLTGFGDGFAAAVDPLDYPDLDGNTPSITPKRPEHVYVATDESDSMKKVKLLTAARRVGTDQRVFTLLGVCNGDLVSVGTGAHTVIAAAAFDTNPQYVSGATLYNQAFWTDGRSYYYHNPKSGSSGTLRSTSSNRIPLRGRIMFAWRGRLGIARFQDAASNIALSKLGDPFNWDFLPANPTVDQAILLSNTTVGMFPDMVNCCAPVSNDLLVVGGDQIIQILRGDPAAGGAFDLVTRDTGIAFGKAWCLDDQGRFWFFGSRGGLYTLSLSTGVQEVSRTKVQKTLRSIDLTANRVELTWNPEEQSIEIKVFPLSNTAALVTMYCFEPATEFFSKDTWSNTSVIPTATCVVDGDSPNDRYVLYGCGDGKVRKWSATAPADNWLGGTGSYIASCLRLVPLIPGLERSAVVSDVELLLNSDQGGAIVAFLASQRADTLGVEQFLVRRGSGDSHLMSERIAGVYHALEIRGDHTVLSRWALERASCAASLAGLRRTVP